jgi:uncharacterized coiled-coil DUF342 family protein
LSENTTGIFAITAGWERYARILEYNSIFGIILDLSKEQQMSDRDETSPEEIKKGYDNYNEIQALKEKRDSLRWQARRLRQRYNSTKNPSSREAIELELEKIRDELENIQKQIEDLEGWV